MRLYLFGQWCYFIRKRFPLCLTGTVSKICWRSCTGTLRRRLTRSHSIVGALSTGICQWDSKSTVWAKGVSSLLVGEVWEERKKKSSEYAPGHLKRNKSCHKIAPLAGARASARHASRQSDCSDVIIPR